MQSVEFHASSLHYSSYLITLPLNSVHVLQVNLKYCSGGIEAIIDPTIEYEYSKLVFTTMTDLALRCAAFERSDRPSMKVGSSSCVQSTDLRCTRLKLCACTLRQVAVATLEMHLAMKSLYSIPKSLSGKQDDEEMKKLLHAELTLGIPEALRQTRGVYVTYDTEYMDSSALQTFNSCFLFSGMFSIMKILPVQLLLLFSVSDIVVVCRTPK